MAKRSSAIQTSPLSLEHKARSAGYFYVIGIDEAGRGAWAGPLSVGYCVLPFTSSVPNPTGLSMNAIVDELSDNVQLDSAEYNRISSDFAGVTDSKLLTPEKRTALRQKIVVSAPVFGAYFVPSHMIDKAGLSEAVKVAVTGAVLEAVTKLTNLHYVNPTVYPVPSVDNVMVLADANLLIPKSPDFYFNMQDYVQGELKSLSIAAASIIAKTERDSYMDAFSDQYWGFAKHKGYGTKDHLNAIETHGLHPEHRRCFGKLSSYKINSAYGAYKEVHVS